MRNNYTDRPKNFMMKELREKNELSREQVAASLGVSISTIVRWENNGIAPALTADEWAILCGLFKIGWTEVPALFCTNLQNFVAAR